MADRPSTSTAEWRPSYTSPRPRAAGGADKGRPRSSRERTHASGNSNRQSAFAGGAGAPRPRSAWAAVGRPQEGPRRAPSRAGLYGVRDAAVPSRARAASKDVIEERQAYEAPGAQRRPTQQRPMSAVDPRKRQRKRVPGADTNRHQIDLRSSAPGASGRRRPETAGPVCGRPPEAPRSKPYQRKEDVNLIRRVAEKLSTLGPAQGAFRNNLQGLEAKTATKVLPRGQLCESFERFGFRKEDITRLYNIVAERKRLQAAAAAASAGDGPGGDGAAPPSPSGEPSGQEAAAGVKVVDFLDFFEHFTPLDQPRATIVQSFAPWNRPQSYRPEPTRLPTHGFEETVSAEDVRSDTVRAFDVHLMNVVRDLLYHKDQVFRMAFRKMDTNRDGRVSKLEFVGKLRELGLNGKQSSRLADMVDKDASEEIDYNEFLSAFDAFNPIERQPAFKENHTMPESGGTHPELVDSVRGRRAGGRRAALCFELLSGKLREREATILRSLKRRDFDQNGIIPAASAVDAIVRSVEGLERYREDVASLVGSVASTTGNVRYREMLSAFKDADDGSGPGRGGPPERFRPPALLNKMRPCSAPTPSAAGGAAPDGQAAAARRRMLQRKAMNEHHHRRQYDSLDAERAGGAACGGGGGGGRPPQHWFDVVYDADRRVGRFASTPDPSKRGVLLRG